MYVANQKEKHVISKHIRCDQIVSIVEDNEKKQRDALRK